jgi:hypothetical protein
MSSKKINPSTSITDLSERILYCAVKVRAMGHLIGDQRLESTPTDVDKISWGIDLIMTDIFESLEKIVDEVLRLQSK